MFCDCLRLTGLTLNVYDDDDDDDGDDDSKLNYLTVKKHIHI